ncbi:MAG: hypothetical protein NPIRA01_03980 [Nitrospirales bacterium]|nr:MAG: hypothetical protein NPIRA01_03980 [Nitrospirales bacterium]
MSLTITRRAASCLFLVVATLVCCTTSWAQSHEQATDHSRFITDRSAKRVIVFIHGIFGDANKAWLNSDTQAYWPDLFDQDPDLREKYAVYVVDYGSPFVSRASTIEEVAIRIHQQLVDRQFFERFKEIYFVTHSMGGLIAKRILVELNRPSENQRLRQVRTVLFLSTPAQGAELADIGEWLSSNPQVEDLKPADLKAFLQSLENQWQNLLRDRDQARHLFPRSYCAYETQATFGMMVVNRIYATSQCDLNPIAIDRNHSDIVKPKDREDDTYRWTKARIQEAANLIEIDVEAALEAYKRKRQQELAMLRDKKQAELFEKETWKKAYKEAIQTLGQKQVEPDKPPGVSEAVRKLADGNTADAAEIFRKSLARKKAEGHGANQEAAEAGRHLGALAFLHDTQTALEAYREAVSLDPNHWGGWIQLGRLLVRVGDLEDAKLAFEKVMELGEAQNDPTLTAMSKIGLGNVHLIRGDFEEAETMFQQSVALFQELGDKEGLAANYANLGNLYRSRGALEQAEAMYLQSVALHQALGSKEGLAANYTNLGNLYAVRGALDQAKAMYLQSVGLYQELGHKEGLASQYTNLGNLYQIRGALEQAEAMYLQSVVLNKALGHKEGLAQNYSNLGLLYQTRGELEQAKEMHQQSLTLHQALGIKVRMAKNYQNLGNVYYIRGELEQAETMYQESLDLFIKVGATRRVEHVRRLLSDLNNLQLENSEPVKK